MVQRNPPRLIRGPATHREANVPLDRVDPSSGTSTVWRIVPKWKQAHLSIRKEEKAPDPFKGQRNLGASNWGTWIPYRHANVVRFTTRENAAALGGGCALRLHGQGSELLGESLDVVPPAFQHLRLSTNRTTQTQLQYRASRHEPGCLGVGPIIDQRGLSCSTPEHVHQLRTGITVHTVSSGIRMIKDEASTYALPPTVGSRVLEVLSKASGTGQ